MDLSFVRYLTAKRTVDDRALSRPVWQALAAAVAEQLAAATTPLQVLEIGAGVGTMVERALEWQLFGAAPGDVVYTAVDAESENVQAAQGRLRTLPQWLTVELVTGDVYAVAADPRHHQRFDLLIAHAVLDLFAVGRVLPRLHRLLKPGGLFYFTINFDGATIFQPEIDPAFDAQLEAAYHRTMDERVIDTQPSGDSQTGRHLFVQLPAAGFATQAAGASDWVVHPVAGRYPADEAYFLHFIVQTMQGALAGHPTLAGIDFDRWFATRHTQIEQGELVYCAHQFDFFGRTFDTSGNLAGAPRDRAHAHDHFPEVTEP